MPPAKRKSGLFSACFPKKEKDVKQQPVGVNNVTVSETEKGGERKTARPRRRVAVAAENSEQLADVRWKSAFDALRQAEQKSEEQIKFLTDLLTKHPILGEMGDEKLMAQLVGAFRTVYAHKDEAVIQQGDAGDAFYILGEGEMAAYIGDDEVATYKPGDSFGELALMYDSPRAATVKCTVEKGSRLYKLGRIQFRKLACDAMMAKNAGLEQQLSNVPLLAELDDEDIKKLAEVMETVAFDDGSYIANMGDPADSLHLILSGEVACHQEGETELRLAEGAVFGESCLAAGKKREANVVAVGPVRTARLMAADCDHILGNVQKKAEASFCKKVINSIDIFSNLSHEERAKLFTQLTMKKVAKGDTIIAQGTVGDTMYIIKHGKAEVLTSSDGAPPEFVASLASGNYFGERSLLKGEPTNSSVVAKEESELMCLSKATFESLLGPMQKLIDREVKRRDEERLKVAEPKVALSDLEVGKLLGEGSFGSVRIAVHKKSSTAYALKALHKGHLISTNQVKNTVNEKTIMKECSHPFILSCVGSFNQKTHVSLLLGLAQGGELFTRMSKVGTLSSQSTAIYVAMVGSALGYLTARTIAHRDLKLENLLFDSQGYLMLVDFGFAKKITDRTWTFCGTPDYLAPEILSHKGHNCAVDWWTLGILTYEMLHGEPPFAEDDQMATFKRIASGQYRISSRVGKDATDLIQRLLVHNPAKRLGMLAGGGNDLLRHPLCASIDNEKLLKKEVKVPWVPKLSDPSDTSNFDDYAEPASSASKKFDKYLDAKYDELWEREFA